MTAELGRLRWQCRRGMRELDQLLLDFLDKQYATASAAQKSAFAELLQLSDPELMAYLMQREPIAEHLRDVVGRILERAPP